MWKPRIRKNNIEQHRQNELKTKPFWKRERMSQRVLQLNQNSLSNYTSAVFLLVYIWLIISDRWTLSGEIEGELNRPQIRMWQLNKQMQTIVNSRDRTPLEQNTLGTRNPWDRTPLGQDTLGAGHPKHRTPLGQDTLSTGHPRDRTP